MILEAHCPVTRTRQVADNVFVLSFHCPSVSHQIKPGQFINIRVSSGTDPLLRRPYSVYRTEGDTVEIIFNVIGKGSTALMKKTEGETIDVLGPLGVPFSVESDGFETALLVGGGLGVAPLPLTTTALLKQGKKVVTFLGARTARQLVETHLQDVHCATDDGSKGTKATVVELLEEYLRSHLPSRPMIFACGPTRMLHATAAVAIALDIPCEVSLEGPMACGFGICQGCPVELLEGERKYALMCKDGPTFDARKIKIPHD